MFLAPPPRYLLSSHHAIDAISTNRTPPSSVHRRRRAEVSYMAPARRLYNLSTTSSKRAGANSNCRRWRRRYREPSSSVQQTTASPFLLFCFLSQFFVARGVIYEAEVRTYGTHACRNGTRASVTFMVFAGIRFRRKTQVSAV